ncbi:phage tail tube protein [Pacificoceanicola onchidii]|uniref:phage tail tube protein n=1 Tax=Pacificoceanicola onchidii TaxID=2562685 RepID=UPI0010A3DDB1|nr:phage tail tube protein [Pacificoceanicola onchidii]
MVKATTEKYEDMVLEVDFDDTDPNPVYARICGMKGVEFDFALNTSETEVPDCDNEGKPNEVELDAQSVAVSVTASGVWAQQANGRMITWLKSGASIPVRCGHINAAVGDPEYETGRAKLVSLKNARPDNKGKVTAAIEIKFDGTPVTENKT